MNRTKRQASLTLARKPSHEKLPWPGLRAKDCFSRTITRIVKEAREASETERWASDQIRRILSYVSPDTVMRLLLSEACKCQGRTRQEDIVTQLARRYVEDCRKSERSNRSSPLR